MEMKNHEETRTMSEAEAEEFDCLSLTKIWNVLKQRVAGKLVGEKYCPVAHIATAYYFDMFNVYAKSPKGFVDTIKSFVSKDKKHSFIAKLGDILQQPDVVNQQNFFNDIAFIEKNKRNLISPKFDVCLIHQEDNLLKKICFLAENAEIYEGSLNLDHVKFTINRNYPGLKTANSILVVNKVVAAKRIRITATCGLKNEAKDWSFEGPWPVGFAAAKCQLDKDGVIQIDPLNPEVTSKQLRLKTWGAPLGAHPPECVTLKAFLQRTSS